MCNIYSVLDRCGVFAGFLHAVVRLIFVRWNHVQVCEPEGRGWFGDNGCRRGVISRGMDAVTCGC